VSEGTATWDETRGAGSSTPLRTPAQQLRFNLLRQARTWRSLLFRRASRTMPQHQHQRRKSLAGAVTFVMVMLTRCSSGVLVYSGR